MTARRMHQRRGHSQTEARSRRFGERPSRSSAAPARHRCPDEVPRRSASEGYVEYAICDGVDYSRVTGSEVALIGHGAFAVENVRTCCEFGSKKIWMVCRRKNLACPRISSWLINQSKAFVNGVLYMRSTEPMYQLTPFDPWSYHSVNTNDRLQVPPPRSGAKSTWPSVSRKYNHQSNWQTTAICTKRLCIKRIRSDVSGPRWMLVGSGRVGSVESGLQRADSGVAANLALTRVV